MRRADDLDRDGRLRWAAVLAALIGHGAVATALLMARNDRPTITPPGVLAVKWIGEDKAAVAPEPPVKPNPLPMKPRVQRVKPVPHSKAAAPTRVAEAPADAAAPAVEAATPVVTAAPGAGSAHVAPAPVVAPRFDADYLANPAPAYPSASRARGEQGKVFLRVFVSSGGDAQEVHVHTGSGYERLDVAARDAVQHWKFVPARQGETAVAAWVLVPISFTLRR
jgi:protein TonB